MRRLIYIIPLALFADLSSASTQGSTIKDQCRKLAKPAWDEGGRGDMYMGNETYRSCLIDNIKKLSRDALPADKQAAFISNMEKSVELLTDAYSMLGDQVDNTGHRKALDPTVDACDLNLYEGLLEAVTKAISIMKSKEIPAKT